MKTILTVSYLALFYNFTATTAIASIIAIIVLHFLSLYLQAQELYNDEPSPTNFNDYRIAFSEAFDPDIQERVSITEAKIIDYEALSYAELQELCKKRRKSTKDIKLNACKFKLVAWLQAQQE